MVKIIETGGKPELVILSYDEYMRLKKLEKPAGPAQKKREICSPVPDMRVSRGVPMEVARRMRRGESPVRAWRLYHDLTQRELAGRVGISIATLSLIENRLRQGKPETVEKLARELRVPVKSLEMNVATP